MNKKISIALLFVVVIGLLFAYLKVGPPPEKEVIRVVTPPAIIASLPIWIAEKEQMFTKRNLVIELIHVTNSRLMVEALLAGNADVLPAVSLADLATTGGPGNLALMHVMVYSHSRMKKKPPFEAILVPTGSRISTLKDLEGAKFAVYPGMTSELAVRYYLKLNHVDPDKVTFVKLPPPEHEPALMRDDVQAIHVYEPFRTAGLQNNKARELAGSVYAELNEPSAIGTSAISRRFYRDKKDVAERYLDVWNEAVQFIRTRPDEAREILAERLGLPKPIALEATWVDATTTEETDFDTLNATVSSAIKAGIIPESFILEKDMVLKK